MTASGQLVVFRLEGGLYAVSLAVVRRIVRAVEVTPLPKAPAIVVGAIDVAGTVLPVLDIRRRFGLPERGLRPSDQFLIARTGRRTVVVIVDEALGVVECPPSGIVGADRIVPGLEHLRGVVQLDDGLVLIHDLETFLSLDEGQALDRALEAEATHGS